LGVIFASAVPFAYYGAGFVPEESGRSRPIIEAQRSVPDGVKN